MKSRVQHAAPSVIGKSGIALGESEEKVTNDVTDSVVDWLLKCFLILVPDRVWRCLVVRDPKEENFEFLASPTVLKSLD